MFPHDEALKQGESTHNVSLSSTENGRREIEGLDTL